MKSLFLRIFLSFWLTMALVTAVMVISSPFWTRSFPGHRQWRQAAESSLQLHGEAAASIMRRGGREALKKALDRPNRLFRHRFYLFDTGGRLLEGQQAPPPIRELASRVGELGKAELGHFEHRHLFARPVTDNSGETYVLVLSTRRPPRGGELLSPWVLVLRLAVVVLIVGVVCYLLGRYLTSPLAKLRDATRRLSQGDLSVRVAGDLGSMKDEIGDLARDFDIMAERVGSLVASQRRLLRDISHELRSPLARLGVALELARQQSGGEATGPLDRIELETGRLNTLIGRLFTLTRLENGPEAGTRERIELTALLEDVVDDAGYEAGARNCKVRFEAGAPYHLEGSAELLRSAFDNVLRNALQYTAEGSTVDVEMHRKDDETAPAVRISIRDRGPGVPEDELDQLFRPFYRVADARDRRTGGTGLGLTITDRAVRHHGGAVTAKNAPGGGLVVEIALPVL